MKTTTFIALTATAVSLALLSTTADAHDFVNTDCSKCSSTNKVQECQKECKIYDCAKTCVTISSNDWWLKDRCQKACPSTPAPTPAPSTTPVPVPAPTVVVYVPVPVPVQAPCELVPTTTPPTDVKCKCNQFTFGQSAGYASAECAAFCGASTTDGTMSANEAKNLRGFEQWQPAPVVAADSTN